MDKAHNSVMYLPGAINCDVIPLANGDTHAWAQQFLHKTV